MARPQKFSDEFKQDFVRRYQASGKTVKAFTEGEPVNYKLAIEWIKRFSETGKLNRHKHGPYTPEQRKQAVEAYFKSGLTQEDFAATWGMSPSTLCGWLQKYEENGAKGLETYAPSKKFCRVAGVYQGPTESYKSSYLQKIYRFVHSTYWKRIQPSSFSILQDVRSAVF